ncbi:MAG: lysylphosphatidylglycerol synthase transmembrane domain-containing protein [Candidatus Binataceae bacterium]
MGMQVSSQRWPMHAARRIKSVGLTHPALGNLASYAAAAAIICWLARNLSAQQFVEALQRANLWLFIPACAFSVVCWFLGETFMYSRLFSYFHGRTTFREMLPVNAVQEFLQAVNMVAASSALALFVHRRKGASWLSAGCTLLFQAFIDFQVIAFVGLAAAITVPSAIFGLAWYWPAVAVAGIGLIVWFWKRGAPHLRVLRWFYERPSMAAFRNAKLSQYLSLILIRTPIYMAQAVVLYLELLAFGLHVPLTYLAAFVPALIAFGTLPIAPAGLGPRQAVIVLGLSAFGSRADLLALALGHSLITIVFRMPLGLFLRSFMRILAGPNEAKMHPQAC